MGRFPNKLVRYAAMSVAFAAFAWSTIGSARADVFGQLRIVLKGSADSRPITGAKVIFHDTSNVRPDVEVQTDEEGNAVSPPLENRDWEVRIEAGGGQLPPQTVTVVADTVTDVEVVAESGPAAPGQPKEAKVNVIRKALSMVEAIRSKRFADLFPVTAGKELSLEGLLRTIPGFTSGAAGQIFARGDQNFGTMLVNGLKLPDNFFGQFTDNITSNLIANLQATTGGLPAEYAGMASSVINMNLQGGTMQPKNGINLFGGTFATFKGAVMLSGQLGKQMGEADASGRVARNLGYFVSLSDRRTDAGITPPQPDEQEPNNQSKYNNLFGNFDYRPNVKDQWNLLVNHAPGETDVPNRTGLDGNWPTDGYGFGGLFGNQGRGQGGLMSQEDLGLDVHQKSVNSFGLISWRRKHSETTDWVVSFGAAHVGNGLRNDNPDVDVMSLPFNSSQEFNPTITRNDRSWQSQGMFHRKTGKHDFKIGYFLDEHNGREAYQMIPGSDLALDALVAADPRLAPAGNDDGTDPLGNPRWFPTDGTVPTLRSSLKRRNRSFFAQDDWKPSDRLAVNYGARYDNFEGEQNLGMSDSKKSMVSPRVNVAYQHDHRTVFKASFNRLFQTPPLVQGALIGDTPKVAVADQFDFSMEKTLGPTSMMRMTAFKKTTDDVLYIRQLIPGLQDGPLSGVNYDEGEAQGIELSIQMTPINNMGISGFLTWTNGTSRASGMGTDGSEAPGSLPADQRNTITAGLNYTWKNGASWALSWDFGSGMPTSDLYGLGVGLSERPSQSRVNFRFQSAQTTFGPFGGFTVDIENLLDSNSVIGFNSPVNGTTFQQGRRIIISAFSQFLTR